MKINGDIIRTVGSATTVLVAASGLVWYVASVEARIRKLEEQVHTLTLAPTIASSSVDKQAGAIQNPIAQACAGLAASAVREASIYGSAGAQMEAEKMLKDLGCVK